ncbi:MAG TPA: hypothetical protein VJ506_10180 [Candidatus Limnocylindrales bacterium]|nr:hypothetical protein [Candidatus Limnocylindrales bacterium]
MSAREPAPAPDEAPVPRLDPASLPSPISRRRAALVAAGLVAAWLLIAFGRQVGDASAASARAAELRAANAGLRADLAALQADLQRVQSAPYIGVAARGTDLGLRHEIPFTLAADAPSLPPDAPGSGPLRVGGQAAPPSPLEAWLDLLLGPGR